MTTAGVWLAIVADVLLLRAAPASGVCAATTASYVQGRGVRPVSKQAAECVEVQDYVSRAPRVGPTLAAVPRRRVGCPSSYGGKKRCVCKIPRASLISAEPLHSFNTGRVLSVTSTHPQRGRYLVKVETQLGEHLWQRRRRALLLVSLILLFLFFLLFFYWNEVRKQVNPIAKF